MHKDLCIGINATRKHLPSRQNDNIGFPSAGLICIDGVVLVAGVEATYGPKSIGSYSQRLISSCHRQILNLLSPNIGERIRR